MEINLTSATDEGEVLNSDKPVLVDFWAPWCGPCRMVGPVISEIAEEYDGKVKVCKLNVDECGDIAAMNAVVSIPTVIIFVDGKVKKKIIGAHAIEDYEDALDELL